MTLVESDVWHALIRTWIGAFTKASGTGALDFTVEDKPTNSRQGTLEMRPRLDVHTTLSPLPPLTYLHDYLQALLGSPSFPLLHQDVYHYTSKVCSRAIIVTVFKLYASDVHGQIQQPEPLRRN
jgi:hypothetical protein